MPIGATGESSTRLIVGRGVEGEHVVRGGGPLVELRRPDRGVVGPLREKVDGPARGRLGARDREQLAAPIARRVPPSIDRSLIPSSFQAAAGR